MNFHQLPDGTKIPPEGLPVIAYLSSGASYEGLLVAVDPAPLDDNTLPYLVQRRDGHLKWYERIKVKPEPKKVPLSFDTYHGEPIRFTAEPLFAMRPTRWDDIQLELPKGATVDWHTLAKEYERLVDGEWQPCYILEEAEVEGD